MVEKEIKCDVVKVLNETETRRGKTRLQIIKWNNLSPTLEKREYWYDDEDNEKPGKAKGLNYDDIKLIIDRHEEIDKLMS